MTVRNRWQDALVMACGSCCWLSPLPPDWIARVYGLDSSGDLIGGTVGDQLDVLFEDQVEVLFGDQLGDTSGALTASSPPSAKNGRSRARSGRSWALWRTTPATGDL